ncbi:hypothetical protein LJR260_003527 [Variovorax paradoxus]|uniref:hypothetical protein n=1 Tax=Variovorax paradoxus TaxID=34073 RepID=UPI0033968249
MKNRRSFSTTLLAVRLVAAGCLFAMATAHAQWAQEPSAVFGVRLGATIEALPVCPPMPQVGYYEVKPTVLCYAPSTYFPGRGDLWGTPDLGFSYHATLNTFEGRVSEIFFNTDHDQFDKAIAVLTERYGRPTETEPGEVVARNGARLTSQTVRWRGQRTSLIAVERVGRIDASTVMFQDNALAARKAAAAASKARDGAAKL